MPEESTTPASAGGAARPRLLDQVRKTIRRKYYSRRTEEAYVHWIKRFIYFTGKRHPATLGETEVTAFLSDLAVVRRVAAATQNQALSALLFLYKEVLGMELGWLNGVKRATRRLLASLPYGAGLRVIECPRLRVKDVDLSCRQILVRDGKGEKDGVTMLPEALIAPLGAHLERVRPFPLKWRGRCRWPCSGAALITCCVGPIRFEINFLMA
ncbi:MAG: phage integrase N-terminal SAM-like domain-containing protein [Pseudomonadota bacterium]